jgi:5-methylcytosine-specific restriction endonuclease McrA
MQMPFLDELPSNAEVFEHWKDKPRRFGLLIDWGEPSCWACGFHYGTKYDIMRADATWSEVLKKWNEMPLQRCHIVPRSLGGSDDADNLFLMCRECHDLAPNTTVPEVFFEWARAQSSWKRDGERIDSAFEAFGIVDADKEALLKLMGSEHFRSWSAGRIGLHRPQSNYPSTLFRLTPTTRIGLAAHYRRSNGFDR